MQSETARELDDTVCKPLGLTLNAGQLHQLTVYEAMLERWNTVYNLTSVRGRDAIRRQHLADCLAIVAPVARFLKSPRVPSVEAPYRILDVGSGGGLPGAVLSIALPDTRVWCIDAVGKKAAFVRHVAAELDTASLHGVHGRVEIFKAEQPFDLIVCRAWTTLDRFVHSTRHLLAPGGVWGAMKARRAVEEAKDVPAGVTVFHVEPLTVPLLDAERCIVWMKPGGDDFRPPESTVKTSGNA